MLHDKYDEYDYAKGVSRGLDELYGVTCCMQRLTEAFAQSIILERVLPAHRGRESAMVPVPKQSHIDIVVFYCDLYWKCGVTAWQRGSIHFSVSDVFPRMADSGSGTGRGTAAASASYSRGWVAEGSIGHLRC